MFDVQACFACLSTQSNLYKIDSRKLENEFHFISGLKESDVFGMPHYLCVECLAQVKRFKRFREKCKRAHFTLKQLLQSRKEVTVLFLDALDRDKLNIASTLSYAKLDKFHYETSIFKCQSYNPPGFTGDTHIPVFRHSTLDVPEEQPEKQAYLPCAKIKKEVPATFDSDLSMDIVNDDFAYDNDFQNDVEIDGLVKEEDFKDIDEARHGMEYASLVPISDMEARAAAEVYKILSKGKFVCSICSRRFSNETLLQSHMRMHDQHQKGNFKCEICLTYYKTDFLYKTHMTEKHLFKYLCKKCPEVNFDRTSAKQHYVIHHLQRSKLKDEWGERRPSWLHGTLKTGKRGFGKHSPNICKEIKKKKLPLDFPKYSPITQEEQYQLVIDRKTTRNYLEASFKCELCYRGFREAKTYEKHMKKHNPEISGQLQCDMCKLYFQDARKMYKHMIITHLFKYSCRECPFFCTNRGQAFMHYRWHKNVTYSCPHCDKEFTKLSTRLTHIRIKHPSTYICNVCGHSFVSDTGLYCHKKIAHTVQELEEAEALAGEKGANYCGECNVHFVSAAAYTTHLGSSSKHCNTNLSIKPAKLSTQRSAAAGRRGGRPPRHNASNIVNNGLPTAHNCDLCGEYLASDVSARRHYEAEHPGAEYLKRYMCDVCGHTTRQYANLMVHMRTHTREKPYGCPHCGRTFSMPSNRDRHLVVHTGEKKYQCQHCSRRFTQSSAVKLHIQTVHLKIPYKPWDKKNRRRRKEMEALSAAGAALSQPPPQKMTLDANYFNAYVPFNDE